MLTSQEQVRRREALAKLERLRDKVRARNEDLTDEQAAALASRFVRDVIDEMVREDKVRFSA